MADIKGAGQLRNLFAFEQRSEIDDGYGNVVGSFSEVFRCNGGRVALRGGGKLTGGESVMASRLTGRQPFIITIRYTAQAALTSGEWRVRDMRTGEIYAITAPPVIRERRDYIDFTCVTGVADTQG